MWNYCRFLSTNIYSPFYLLIISPRSPSSLFGSAPPPRPALSKAHKHIPHDVCQLPGSARLTAAQPRIPVSLFFSFFLFLPSSAAASSEIRRPGTPLVLRPGVSWVGPGQPRPPAGSSCLLWEVLRGVTVARWASGSHTVDIYYFILRPAFAPESREAANIQRRG